MKEEEEYKQVILGFKKDISDRNYLSSKAESIRKSILEINRVPSPRYIRGAAKKYYEETNADLIKRHILNHIDKLEKINII